MKKDIVLVVYGQSLYCERFDSLEEAEAWVEGDDGPGDDVSVILELRNVCVAGGEPELKVRYP